MREDDFSLRTPDGFTVYGRVSFAGEGTAAKAVILSHGLTGNPYEYLHQAARDHFTARGYDVIRFAYYADQGDARKLSDCTLAIHAADMNLVVGHFAAAYGHLYLAGHSYGGLTALLANPAVAAISLWDPSYLPYETLWRSIAHHLPELDCYVIGWGTENLIGKAMYEEAKSLNREKLSAMARTLKAPAQVIVAGGEERYEHRLALYEDLGGAKTLEIIEDADHCFTRAETVRPLLEKTALWFSRFPENPG